jgi:hypothetical protein
MIGQKILVEEVEEGGKKTLKPKDQAGNALTESLYQPPKQVMELFARCMKDYQVAYNLQHRPFDYFDGYSLLERTKMDQRTFAAFVGAEFVPQQKKWRWRGRKNTARNKLIGIAAHMLVGMLFPTVFAWDDQNKEQKLAARVMRLQVEHHLRKARYDLNFLFSVLSALVAPAVFVQVEWIEYIRKVRVEMENGTITVQEAIDETLSGLQLHIRPVDEVMLGDFYTFNIQKQPCVVEVERISWDLARARFAGKCFTKNAVSGQQQDLFDFVQAGKTRVVIATQEKQVLYDVEWTEADRDFVQVLTFKYPFDDIEALWVGGVFMGDEGDAENDIYASNPMKHRRMTMVFDGEGKPQWGTAPYINIAKSGFEPIDPSGRFAYYKSGAFKEFWEDDSINHAYRLLEDGMTLDVIKPMVISGVARVDGTVMSPGATVAIPDAAGKVTPYSLSPNLAAAMQVIQQNQADMSESTIDKILEGQLGVRQTALAVNAALTNAKIMLGLFGLLIGDLVQQIGDLTIDCINMHATAGMLDTTVPGALGMKYKTFLVQSKEHSRDVVHRIVYTDKYYGKKFSASELREREWALWEEDGGAKAQGHTWEVNPYATMRLKYATFVDADEIISRSIGGDKQRKQVAFDMLTDPRVAPFVDMETVVGDLVIDEYGGNDPDRYKKKGNGPMDQDAMMKAIMGNSQGGQGDGGQGGEVLPNKPQQPGGASQTRASKPPAGGGGASPVLQTMQTGIPHGQ